MFANVFTKTTRDRLPSGFLGAVVVGFFLFFSMWVYKDVDTSFYYELPEAVLELMGIDPSGEGAGQLAFSAIYTFIGAFVVAGLAISAGASSIAGEERDGTLGLLLGNPVSRRGVLVSKALSMELIAGLMVLIMWVVGLASAVVLDVETDGLFIGAMTLALFVNGLVYGFLAMAVGSWIGKRSVASSVAVGVMIVGYLAANLLPLADMETAAKFSPWYYFSSSQPLTSGLDWTHVGVLITMALVGFGVSWVGVQRRDLREKGTDVTLLDRLRANPTTKKVIDRLAGSTRVSRIWVKTVTDYQGLLTITAGIMFYMGVFIPILYNFIPDDFIDVFASFPDAVVAMIGGVDMSTPEGFLTGELFALVGPIAVIVLLTSMGGKALAGEEEKKTMGMLLANPISRSHVIAENVIAMVVNAAIFGVVTFLGTWAGVALGGLDTVGVDGIGSISLTLSLFGLLFGAVALLVSAATGRTSMSNLATTGVALITWFMFSFFPLSETFEPLAQFSPWYWYLGGDPLLNGMDWGGAALLAGVSAVLVALSIPMFQRRDLRG